jgi:hypothetical protein
MQNKSQGGRRPCLSKKQFKFFLTIGTGIEKDSFLSALLSNNKNMIIPGTSP